MANITVDAVEVRGQHSTETVTYICNFGPLLKDGETLTGTPSATLSGLAIASVTINSSEVTDAAGNVTAANEGVQFKVSGATSETTYRIPVTSTISNGDIRTVICRLRCVED